MAGPPCSPHPESNGPSATSRTGLRHRAHRRSRSGAGACSGSRTKTERGGDGCGGKAEGVKTAIANVRAAATVVPGFDVKQLKPDDDVNSILEFLINEKFANQEASRGRRPGRTPRSWPNARKAPGIVYISLHTAVESEDGADVEWLRAGPNGLVPRRGDRFVVVDSGLARRRRGGGRRHVAGRLLRWPVRPTVRGALRRARSSPAAREEKLASETTAAELCAPEAHAPCVASRTAGERLVACVMMAP